MKEKSYFKTNCKRIGCFYLNRFKILKRQSEISEDTRQKVQAFAKLIQL
jgi:hypothetical protein